MAEDINGLFFDSLTRNNKQIKEDRGAEITEDAQISYKQRVEKTRLSIKKKHRARRSMLDLSPTNSLSLMLADEFQGEDFAKKDEQIGLEIRDLEIRLGVLEARYKELFGEDA